MEQVIDIPQQEVITKDNATVTVDGVAFYQVFDAAKASYEVTRLDQAIITLTMTNIRSVMGAMDLDQMLSHRDEINESLLRVVDAAVRALGRQGQPHRDQGHRAAGRPGRTSMGRQMKAEREKRARGSGSRRPAPVGDPARRGPKQSQILEAEGRREAAFRDAEGRERTAQAEAKATEMVSRRRWRAAMSRRCNYFIAEKYSTPSARSPTRRTRRSSCCRSRPRA